VTTVPTPTQSQETQSAILHSPPHQHYRHHTSLILFGAAAPLLKDDRLIQQLQEISYAAVTSLHTSLFLETSITSITSF